MKPTKSTFKRSPWKLCLRIFWGLFFLAAAAVIAMQTFGVISLGLQIGTLFLIILLTAIIIASAIKLFWIGVFMPAAFGVLLLSQSGIISSLTGEQTGMLFAIAALVSVGFHILFHQRWLHHGHTRHASVKSGAETNFGSAIKYFNEEPLDHADIDCNFGSVKAYFTEAKLKNKTANINVDCNFGSVELFVPKDWRIEQRIDNSFSGTEEKNHPNLTDASPVVTLTGECNFGSIVIVYI